MSEYLRREQDEINAANAEHDVENSRKLEARVKELEEMITLVQEALSVQIEINTDHGDRLHNLEEKERARARDEHARNEHLDFVNSEGLGET